jgi:two-component system LytT family response regulator
MTAAAQALQLCVLTVDDEAPARKRLIQLLQRDPQVGKVLEAGDGFSAIDIIQAERPDVLFLDVQMPRLDGFGLIQALGGDDIPHTIFVTAYDHYAVRAFEADATDYLLKPFSDERFVQAMTRVKARIRNREAPRLGANVAEAAARAEAPPDRLMVKTGGVVRFINTAEIDWIEAADVYVNLHVGEKEILYRSALHQLAARLDPVRFVRIHRSIVVNLERIKELEMISHGEFEVVMMSGARLRLSRKYRAEFDRRLWRSL